MLFKVHTSNYRIEGFTKEVGARELAVIAAEHKVPLVHDLGSGTLVDLVPFGTSFGFQQQPSAGFTRDNGVLVLSLGFTPVASGPGQLTIA